ncbi:MAG: acetate kinase [Thermodesulfobacteria bacterium]|nr:acetate kinase [Thermodesulfobacteriota bacterium]
MKVLVLNSGSSSLKFKIFSQKDLHVLSHGLIEEIGTGHGSYHLVDPSGQLIEGKANIPDHKAALDLMSALLKKHTGLDQLDHLYGIGHRVVHGGESFKKAVLIDEDVLETIKKLIPLAPLHNPANLLGIKIALEHAPNVPQVAVFDTAFHQGMPPHSYLYAIPKDIYEQHGIRRYGFHGTSYSYVTRQAARFLNKDYSSLSCICLHLGNGASCMALKDGECVDTSMGLTPLEGLVMGTRCGDIDPAIIFFLNRTLGMDIDDIDHLLNKKSGLLGLCGESDMRSIAKRFSAGDPDARIAIDLFCYRIKKYIGSYMAVIGRPDCLIFTAGIGENSTLVRQKVCEGLEHMGIRLDKELNEQPKSDKAPAYSISASDSDVHILVVPTDEELEIARQTIKVIGAN